jgi:hypothetical protein
MIKFYDAITLNHGTVILEEPSLALETQLVLRVVASAREVSSRMTIKKWLRANP